VAGARAWAKRARPLGGDRRAGRVEAHKDTILVLLEATPDIAIDELRQAPTDKGVTVDYKTIRRFFARHAITRKKDRTRGRAGVSRHPERREAWFEGQLDLDPERLVFIDETWASTNMARTHGRCRRGERPYVGDPHGHWKTMTFVAGLTTRHDRAFRARRPDQSQRLGDPCRARPLSRTGQGRHPSSWTTFPATRGRRCAKGSRRRARASSSFRRKTAATRPGLLWDDDRRWFGPPDRIMIGGLLALSDSRHFHRRLRPFVLKVSRSHKCRELLAEARLDKVGVSDGKAALPPE
jgi:hypothetical protein